MTREPNAVDFWRGFALITIFIDHVPGLFYASYTLANLSISDAADLFVFLAGWSLRLMAEGRGEPRPIRDVMLRLFGRALELYAAQAMITMLAIALLAVSATELDNPLLLQWHNAAAVFTTRCRPISASPSSRTSSAISTSCRSTSCSCSWRRSSRRSTAPRRRCCCRSRSASTSSCSHSG